MCCNIILIRRHTVLYWLCMYWLQYHKRQVRLYKSVRWRLFEKPMSLWYLNDSNDLIAVIPYHQKTFLCELSEYVYSHSSHKKVFWWTRYVLYTNPFKSHAQFDATYQTPVSRPQVQSLPQHQVIAYSRREIE